MTTAPSGFHAADRLQQKAFDETGSIPGASKVTIDDGTLFTRLRPPRDWTDAMVLAYKQGWAYAKTQFDMPQAEQTAPWETGYLDQAAGRMKWHTPHCPSHRSGITGCGVA